MRLSLPRLACFSPAASIPCAHAHDLSSCAYTLSECPYPGHTLSDPVQERSFKASMPRKESLINLPVHTLFQSVYAPGRVSYQSTCAHALSKRLCPGKSLLLIYLCTRSFKASMPRELHAPQEYTYSALLSPCAYAKALMPGKMQTEIPVAPLPFNSCCPPPPYLP